MGQSNDNSMESNHQDSSPEKTPENDPKALELAKEKAKKKKEEKDFSPVGIIQELFDRLKMTPVYAFTQLENAHFKVVVKLEGKEGEGTAINKKKAKHAAAKDLLVKIEGLSIEDLAQEKLNREAAKAAGSEPLVYLKPMTKIDIVNQIMAGENFIAMNYVGALHEICKELRLTLPIYHELTPEKVINADVYYRWGSVVSGMILKGEGISKKKAKQDAARATIILKRAQFYYESFKQEALAKGYTWCIDSSMDIPDDDVL